MAWSWVRRVVQLYAGLALYGFSMALMVKAQLGLDPWDVFHQGLAERTGWSFGVTTIVVGAAVLLLWLPMRQRPGVGTISNVFVIGVAVDASLAWLPTPDALGWRLTFLLSGVVLNAVAGGAYIGARLGPGPRDGLMTGMVRKTGRSVRLVRTTIEIAVLAIGFVLGGSVGLGTVVYALAIGPLVQIFLPVLTVPKPRPTEPTEATEATEATEPTKSTEPAAAAPHPAPEPESLEPVPTTRIN